ncbi:hypothetical protein ACE15W_00070 [Bifidobacterium catenulatum subsp. kashiwanohense]|uniref:hypothetical protein n=1 Tax=Bifidobacterium catenulatum TaxID=1686 RepID=UPI003D06FEC0
MTKKNWNPLTQSRDWCATIPAFAEDDPATDDRLTPEQLEERLKAHPTWSWIFSLESGEKTGYMHFQLYVQAPNPIKSGTLVNVVGETAHIERMERTPQDNIAYCSKSDTHVDGPWQSAKEFDLNHRGAKMKSSSQKGSSLSEELHDEIMSGTPPWEARHDPRFVKGWNQLSRPAQEWWSDYLATHCEDRDVTCYYLWGDTRLGKTHSTLDYFGRENAYRVTDYNHPFELYRGQPVLILDEFSGQIPATVMNTWLEPYQSAVNVKYSTVVPQWTTVVVISNLPLDDQYQSEKPAISAAFRARFKGHMLHQTTRWSDHEFVNPWSSFENDVSETPEIPKPPSLPSGFPKLSSLATQLSAYAASPAFQRLSSFDRERYVALYELLFEAGGIR